MAARWIGRIGWTLLAASLVAVVGLASWEPYFAEQPGPPPPDRRYAAEISRDVYGVPHIYGKTDPDVAFGVAWAQAVWALRCSKRRVTVCFASLTWRLVTA